MKLRRYKLVLMAMAIIIFAFSGCSEEVVSDPLSNEPSPESSTMITVSRITFSDLSTIDKFYFTDEQETDIDMPENWNAWFENATVEDVSLIGSLTNVSMNPNGTFNVTNSKLSEDSKLLFVFMVDEEEYRVGLYEGAQIAVKKSEDDTYILLPEETVHLSPPPVIESEAEGE